MAHITFDELKAKVAEKLNVDEKKITPEARFIEDLEADSLDTVELIMYLEEEYGITISDEDVDKLRSVGDVLLYLQSNV
jgi:acyl carrier protein